MKAFKIVLQIIIIYGIYLIGVYLQTSFKIAIPGSIIGMLLLLSLFMANMIKPHWLVDGAQFLLSHLTLLFLPATAGVVGYLSFFKGKGIITILIVIISTCLVMLCSGFIGQFTARKLDKKAGKLEKQSMENCEL